jgi:hypothetical protein
MADTALRSFTATKSPAAGVAGLSESACEAPSSAAAAVRPRRAAPSTAKTEADRRGRGCAARRATPHMRGHGPPMARTGGAKSTDALTISFFHPHLVHLFRLESYVSKFVRGYNSVTYQPSDDPLTTEREDQEYQESQSPSQLPKHGTMRQV